MSQNTVSQCLQSWGFFLSFSFFIIDTGKDIVSITAGTLLQTLILSTVTAVQIRTSNGKVLKVDRK